MDPLAIKVTQVAPDRQAQLVQLAQLALLGQQVDVEQLVFQDQLEILVIVVSLAKLDLLDPKAIVVLTDPQDQEDQRAQLDQQDHLDPLDP